MRTRPDIRRPSRTFRPIRSGTIDPLRPFNPPPQLISTLARTDYLILRVPVLDPQTGPVDITLHRSFVNEFFHL